MESERYYQWLQRAEGHPPEWLANYIASPQAKWIVTTADGQMPDRRHAMARLESETDLPYWAFVLAKSYLDDVGEWPLFGMNAEQALEEFADHGNASRAVREILHSVLPVWPDVTVCDIAYERHAIP